MFCFTEMCQVVNLELMLRRLDKSVIAKLTFGDFWVKSANFCQYFLCLVRNGRNVNVIAQKRLRRGNGTLLSNTQTGHFIANQMKQGIKESASAVYFPSSGEKKRKIGLCFLQKKPFDEGRKKWPLM